MLKKGKKKLQWLSDQEEGNSSVTYVLEFKLKQLKAGFFHNLVGIKI